MLGVITVIVAGLLLSVSVGAYSQFLINGNAGEIATKAKCGRHCNSMNYTQSAHLVRNPNLLIAGLLSGSFGIALLVVRRGEIEG